MDTTLKKPGTPRHTLVQYALLAQPRPGNREIRMRGSGGAWLQRNHTEGTI